MRRKKQRAKETDETQELVKKINFHKEEIAKHRDALREALEELGGNVAQSADYAIDELESAIDHLSQHA